MSNCENKAIYFTHSTDINDRYLKITSWSSYVSYFFLKENVKKPIYLEFYLYLSQDSSARKHPFPIDIQAGSKRLDIWVMYQFKKYCFNCTNVNEFIKVKTDDANIIISLKLYETLFTTSTLFNCVFHHFKVVW